VVDKLIYEDPLLIAKQRSHTGALNQYRLIKKNDDEHSDTNGDQDVACPNANFVANKNFAGHPGADFQGGRTEAFS